MGNEESRKLQSFEYHMFLLMILAVAWCLSHYLPFHP